MIQKLGFWGSIASIISLILVFALPSGTTESQSDSRNQSPNIVNTAATDHDIFNAISKTIKEICQAPSSVGKYWNVKLDGSGNTTVKVKVADADLKGNATFSKGEWEGVQRVLQEQQAQDNEGYRRCSEKLTPIFLEKFSNKESEHAELSPREKLSRMGINWSVASFVEAARQGDIHTMELFLSGGMKPDVKNDKEIFVISCAALDDAENMKQIIDLFLLYGLDLNKEHSVSGKFTWQSGPQVGADISFIALTKKRPEIIRYIVSKGGDLSKLLEELKKSTKPYGYSDDVYAMQLANRVAARIYKDPNEQSRLEYISILESILNPARKSGKAP